MDFNTFKEIAIAQAQSMGIADYELYYKVSQSSSVSVFQHEVNEFTASTAGGVCFRCIVNGRMGYASTEELSEAQAKAVVVRAAENAAVLESDEPEFLCPGGQEYASLDLHPYALPSTEALIAAALDAQEKLYAADPAVVDGTQTESLMEHNEIAICNSKGLDLHYANNLSGLVTSAVVRSGEETEDDFGVKLGALECIDIGKLAADTAASAKAKLGGDVAPTGAYPVIFSPKAMADLLSTFCGIFSSESAQKGLSRLADQESEIIASPMVTLVDDPFHKDNPMPINFDAEGCPTYCKKVIENGRLNTLLYNMKTAAVAGKKTTGNAFKSGYSSSVTVLPFTMYLAPGEYSEEALLQKAGSGVYINALGGLHAGANPISGDFSLQSAGFLIEDGRKTTHVKSFTVAGNFYDLMKNITAVGSNLELPMPLGMTAFGSPSVLVENLSIAGK